MAHEVDAQLTDEDVTWEDTRLPDGILVNTAFSVWTLQFEIFGTIGSVDKVACAAENAVKEGHFLESLQTKTGTRFDEATVSIESLPALEGKSEGFCEQVLNNGGVDPSLSGSGEGDAAGDNSSDDRLSQGAVLAITLIVIFLVLILVIVLVKLRGGRGDKPHHITVTDDTGRSTTGWTSVAPLNDVGDNGSMLPSTRYAWPKTPGDPYGGLGIVNSIARIQVQGPSASRATQPRAPAQAVAQHQIMDPVGMTAPVQVQEPSFGNRSQYPVVSSAEGGSLDDWYWDAGPGMTLGGLNNAATDTSKYKPAQGNRSGWRDQSVQLPGSLTISSYDREAVENKNDDYITAYV